MNNTYILLSGTFPKLSRTSIKHTLASRNIHITSLNPQPSPIPTHAQALFLGRNPSKHIPPPEERTIPTFGPKELHQLLNGAELQDLIHTKNNTQNATNHTLTCLRNLFHQPWTHSTAQQLYTQALHCPPQDHALFADYANAQLDHLPLHLFYTHDTSLPHELFTQTPIPVLPVRSGQSPFKPYTTTGRWIAQTPTILHTLIRHTLISSKHHPAVHTSQTNLRSLDVFRADLDSPLLHTIANLPHLQHLSLLDCPTPIQTPPKGLHIQSPPTHLKLHNVDSPTHSARSLIRIALDSGLLGNTQHLFISPNLLPIAHHTSAHLHTLSTHELNRPDTLHTFKEHTFPQLKHLRISPSLSSSLHPKEAAHILSLPALRNLTTLSWGEHSSTHNVFPSTQLSQDPFPNLKHLSIPNGHQLSLESFQSNNTTPLFPNLTHLSLSGADISAPLLHALLSKNLFPNLTHLSLSFVRLKPKDAHAIAQSTTLRNLSFLDLSHTRLKPEHIIQILNNPHITSMRALCCNGCGKRKILKYIGREHNIIIE